MKTALNIIQAFINPADEANEATRKQVQHTVRQYAERFKLNWHKRVVVLGDGLSIRFRAIANSKSSESIFVKFAYIHDRVDVPDIDFVLQTSVDQDMMDAWYAKRVRAVTKDNEYKHTQKDEHIMLSTNPESCVEDIAARFHDHADPLNVLAKKLFKDAHRHIGERHVENDVPVPEKIVPFDYAHEMLRLLKAQGRIIIEDHCELIPHAVTALKADDDVVLKFKITGEGWAEDSLLNLYITIDNLFNAAAVRKIRIVSKSTNDYSDSDDDHPVTLQPHPVDAARELVDNLQHDSIMSHVMIGMLMRAKNYMINGGEEE